MITLSIVLNIWFIPIPFWSLILINRYYPFEHKKGIGMAFLWPILMLIRIWFLIRRKKKGKLAE